MKNHKRKVTIVVPVYGDWNSLKECIASLKEHVDSRHSVMYVNDCGPEADILEKNILKAIEGYNNFSYHRNVKNLGFVQNCNNAVLKLDKSSNDILLLNSDTVVTKGFLEEMLDALYSNNKYGAVSPRSNNATLCTIPLSAAPKKGIDPRKSYKLYQKMKPYLPKTVKTPVAHGFCMLIKRPLIKKYGLFDIIFGKGYGEEVDFCQRIRQHGYSCILANKAYVYHKEAKSFTIETKNQLLEKNNKIIWERYPTYREEVRDYMQEAIKAETNIELKATKIYPNAYIQKAKNIAKNNRFTSKIIKKIRP